MAKKAVPAKAILLGSIRGFLELSKASFRAHFLAATSTGGVPYV